MINKLEALNRGIDDSHPKDVTFGRNAIARKLSAVARLNDGRAIWRGIAPKSFHVYMMRFHAQMIWSDTPAVMTQVTNRKVPR